jgi:hypothetical protein
MQLNQELGGYHKGVIRLLGSFRIDGTSDPDVIRDGNTNMITSVVRTSEGLFTVTFRSGFPLPAKLISWNVHVAQAANPTASVRAYYVRDSFSQTARTFQIQVGDFAGDEVIDPDDNDMIAFELVGSILSVGQDSA